MLYARFRTKSHLTAPRYASFFNMPNTQYHTLMGELCADFFLGNIKLYFISYVISWLWWVQLFELIHESENSIFIKFMKRLCMVWFGLKYAYELPNRGASKRYLRNSSISIIFIIIQIRRSHDRLIFIMGIPIPVNMVFVLRRDLGHLGLITHLKYKTAGFAGQL